MSLLKQLKANTFLKQSCKISRGYEAGTPSTPDGKTRPLFLTCSSSGVLGDVAGRILGHAGLLGSGDGGSLKVVIGLAGHWDDVADFVFSLQEFFTFLLVGSGEVSFTLLIVARELVFNPFEAVDYAVSGAVAVNAFELAAVIVGALFGISVVAGEPVVPLVALVPSVIDGLEHLLELVLGEFRGLNHVDRG
jgi:hypothetical protein